MYENTKLLLRVILCNLVRAMDPSTVDLLTPLQEMGEACGYDACPKLSNDVLNVHIVPHSHAELGLDKHFEYHWSGWDYNETYGIRTSLSKINMKMVLDATITELWANQNRKFTLSDSELPYFFHWWKIRDSTVRRMVYELLRQGRLNIVGGGWGMHEQSVTNYQAIIDSYTYSLRKLNRTFLSCARPLVAWQADNIGHSREYASLVAQMGFDGLFISHMSFDEELIRMDRKALEFLWRGSDDLGKRTDIFTSKLFDAYWSPPGFCFELTCTDPRLVTVDNEISNLEERVALFIEHMKYRQAPYYKTNHIMVVMGSVYGYYAARSWYRNIDALINEVNEKSFREGLNLYVHYSSPHCFLKAIHESRPILEPRQDDLLPFAYDKFSYMSGIYTSRPDLKYIIRVGHVYLQIVKQLQVLADLKYDDILESFMWIMGVMQDHNIISGSVQNHVKQYYIKRLNDIIEKSVGIIEDGVNVLFKTTDRIKYHRCDFNSSSCPYTTKSSNFHIMIYNPLSWRLSMPVRIPVEKAKYIVYDPKGSTIPASLLPTSSHVLNIRNRDKSTDHEIVFIANDVPALGFKSYYLEKVIKQKRSIIKKINPHPQKYYIRQASDVFNKTYFEENANYEEISDVAETINSPKYDYSNPKDDDTNEKNELNQEKVSKIDFASINNYTADHRNVITPKYFKPVTQQSLLSTTTESVTSTSNQETDSPLVDDYANKDEITETTSKARPDLDVSSSTGVSSTTVTTASTVEESTEITTKAFEKSQEITHTPHYANKKYDVPYFGTESKDNFIENKYIKISLDDYRKVSTMTLSNKLNTSLDIQFYYYVSDDPKALGKDEDVRSPGAYIFRPMDTKPVAIADFFHTKIYKTDIVQEVHTMYSEYASIVLKLYTDNPCVEVDWTIGPVPIDDELGKEVFIRYTSDIENAGVFFTDANGRQTIKRIRDRRATYEPYYFNRISGNFYPVTSRIYIEDPKKNIRISILNDRSQGGSSLVDGAIDLMIQRRILTDDGEIGAVLNETIDGEGVIVSGKHYLYLSKADYKPNKVFEKKLAKEVELKPIYLVSNSEIDRDKWLRTKMEFTGINKLPIGVHLLTLQDWNDGTLLVRLENYLEKCDTVKKGIKYVHLKNIFRNIEIEKIKETTLAGNIWLKDWMPLRWETNSSFLKNFNEYYGTDEVNYADDEEYSIEEADLESGIQLIPQQIRTFVVWFKRKNVT